MLLVLSMLSGIPMLLGLSKSKKIAVYLTQICIIDQIRLLYFLPVIEIVFPKETATNLLLVAVPLRPPFILVRLGFVFFFFEFFRLKIAGNEF